MFEKFEITINEHKVLPKIADLIKKAFLGYIRDNVIERFKFTTRTLVTRTPLASAGVLLRISIVRRGCLDDTNPMVVVCKKSDIKGLGPRQKLPSQAHLAFEGRAGGVQIRGGELVSGGLRTHVVTILNPVLDAYLETKRHDYQDAKEAGKAKKESALQSNIDYWSGQDGHVLHWLTAVYNIGKYGLLFFSLLRFAHSVFQMSSPRRATSENRLSRPCATTSRSPATKVPLKIVGVSCASATTCTAVQRW